MIEKLGTARRSYEVTEEQATELEKMVALLRGEMALAREESSEVDRL